MNRAFVSADRARRTLNIFGSLFTLNCRYDGAKESGREAIL
jgi:hypothetical protein